MPSLSCCPECLGEITIPSLPDPLRRLRCPLCQVEFPAHQALATSRRLPPEATLVQPETAVDSSPFELADTRAEPFRPETDADAAPESAPAGLPADQSRTADGFDLTPVEMPPGGVTGDVGPGLMLAAAMSNPASAATATQPSDTAHQADDEADDAGPYRVQSRLGSRSKGVGVVGQLVGIFGGAIVGSAIGYYVLLWIGGARADFLDLRHKLPDWLVPGGAEAVQAGHEADGEPASENPAENFFGGRRGHIQQDGPDGPTAGPGETEPPTDVAVAGTPPPAGPLGESPGGASSVDTGSPPSAEAVPLGPRHVTPYTPDELAGILAETGSKVICPVCDATGLVRRVQESPGNGAQAANSAPAAGSNPPQVACPECTGRAAKGLTPEAYGELCRLAEAVTFVRIDPDDPSFDNRRRAVQNLLLRAVGDGEKRHTVGRLAGMRLEAGSGLNNGVALAGTVQDVAQEGSLYRTRLVLFGTPKLVTVLSREAPQPVLKPQDRVLILGIVVDNPRENLAGYAGELSQVVWGGLAQKLGIAQ